MRSHHGPSPPLMSLLCHSISLNQSCGFTRLCSLKGSFFSSCCCTSPRTEYNHCCGRCNAPLLPADGVTGCQTTLGGKWRQSFCGKLFCLEGFPHTFFFFFLCQCHTISPHKKSSYFTCDMWIENVIRVQTGKLLQFSRILSLKLRVNRLESIENTRQGMTGEATLPRSSRFLVPGLFSTLDGNYRVQ